MFELLKKLELGVFFFCWRQASLAQSEDKLFSSVLREQCSAEHSHARYFALQSGSNILDLEYYFSREPRSQNWSFIDNEYYADGMSVDYLCSRVFFMGKSAYSFSWADKLAYMIVLEQFQVQFYSCLMKYLPNQQAIHRIIMSEELHSLLLENAIDIETKYSILYILKWRFFKYLALLFVPIDLLWIWVNHWGKTFQVSK
jgi:hypothetical protein